MKKIAIIALTAFASVLYALDAVMVDNNGTLAYPDKATFAQKNDLASTAKPYIYIDMMVDADADDVSVSNIRGFAPDRSTSTTRWIPYDVELKVVDNSTGQLVYWFSTTKGSYTQGSDNYLNYPKRDVNAKCFVLMRNAKDGYTRPTWISFNGNTYPHASIYAFKNSRSDTSALTGIGGIIIVPSSTTKDGTSTKAFFNPNDMSFINGAYNGKENGQIPRYSVIYLRISPDRAETVNGQTFWQAANIFNTGSK